MQGYEIVSLEDYENVSVDFENASLEDYEIVSLEEDCENVFVDYENVFVDYENVSVDYENVSVDYENASLEEDCVRSAVDYEIFSVGFGTDALKGFATVVLVNEIFSVDYETVDVGYETVSLDFEIWSGNVCFYGDEESEISFESDPWNVSGSETSFCDYHTKPKRKNH